MADALVKGAGGGDQHWEKDFSLTGTDGTVHFSCSTAGVISLGAGAHTASGSLSMSAGSATGAKALNFGDSLAEGLSIKILEETVDLTSAGAKFVAMTTAVPAGAVILSASANVQTLVVAGGTTAKVALGLNGGDVDKYGKTTNLTLDQKISTIPAHAVLAGAETIDVCGVTSDGSALGDTNISAGSVRVRIVYFQLADLANA
jgi:hypothetical protein